MTRSELDRLAAAAPAVGRVGENESRAMLDAIVGGELALTTVTHRRAPVFALVAVVAVVTAALVVVRETPRSVSTAITDVTATPLPAEKVRLAMAAAEHAIVHVRTDYGNGVLWEAWFDEARNRSRTVSSNLDGSPLYDHEQSGPSMKVVSYNDRAWWTYQLDDERELGRGRRGAISPEQIRAQLADGILTEVGRETTDGQALVRLRWSAVRKGDRIVQPGDLWVDADSYLPVRQVSDGGKVTVAYRWLPVDEETEARLETTIPPGFRRLPQAPDAPAGAPSLG